MKIGVILSGCGAFDGAEIHESTSILIALDKLGAEALCMAPDIEQHHVINHMTGEEMPEKRNVLIESSRIARGNIRPLSEYSASDLDALVLSGGFGGAKNLTKWAFEGPAGSIEPETNRLIKEMINAGKPIASLCVTPVVLAKVLENTGINAEITVGTIKEPSPYDINGFNEGLNSVGMLTKECPVGEIVVDEKNRIVTTPCYMMEATPSQIYDGIYRACEKLLKLAEKG